MFGYSWTMLSGSCITLEFECVAILRAVGYALSLLLMLPAVGYARSPAVGYAFSLRLTLPWSWQAHGLMSVCFERSVCQWGCRRSSSVTPGSRAWAPPWASLTL